MLHVELPLVTVRSGDPGFGLLGETALCVVDARGLEARLAHATIGGHHLLGGLGFDAEVVDRAVLTGSFEDHQLEGRVLDGPVGVTGLHLGRSLTEQLRVEVDGGVQIVHVQGQLQSHALFLSASPAVAN